MVTVADTWAPMILRWRGEEKATIQRLRCRSFAVIDPGRYGAGAVFKSPSEAPIEWSFFDGLLGCARFAKIVAERQVEIVVVEDQFVGMHASAAEIYKAAGRVEAMVAMLSPDSPIVEVPPQVWQYATLDVPPPGKARPKGFDVKALSVKTAIDRVPTLARIASTKARRSAIADVVNMARWFRGVTS